MGLNQSLPFFSMENERVERLSQRVVGTVVSQWNDLGFKCRLEPFCVEVACSPCLALSLDTSASSSMYIQRYTWALVRLIGRKIGHWCECFSISSSQTGSLSRVYPISCPVAAWIGFSTPMIVNLIFVCKMLMLIIKLFQFYFIFKRD